MIFSSVTLTGAATFLAVAVSVATSLCLLAHKLKELYQVLASHVCVIGIAPRVAIPPELEPLPDFTNYREALASGRSIVLLHTRTLSYALRKCDWVVYDDGGDPKIHTPSDKSFWRSIVNDTAGRSGGIKCPPSEQP